MDVHFYTAGFRLTYVPECVIISDSITGLNVIITHSKFISSPFIMEGRKGHNSVLF